jgi:hypothetical protein
LRAGQFLQAFHEQHTYALLIFDCVAFAAPRAQPEVSYGVPVGRLLLLARGLLKAEQTALPVIEIGRAIRVGAFQIHGLLFRRLVHRLPQNHRKSKIPAGAKTVKLNKWIQRIRAFISIGAVFSVSQIVI